jgi:hemoglobin
MRESHQQLNITEGQWQAMVAEFQKTLDKFKVPAKEQGELITIVNSTKADIVAPAKSQR